MREIRTSGLMRGYWKRGMGEIRWHRRETRRQTEKTNVVLNYRASTLLYRMNLRLLPYPLGQKLLNELREVLPRVGIFQKAAGRFLGLLP
jgi:hypothetical protein